MRARILCAIIKNTIQKEKRNKMLIFSTITSVIIILGVNSVLSFLYGLKDPAFNINSLVENKFELFYSALNMWTWILSILIGIGGISSDFDHQVIGQILSLPIERKDYLIGRLVGAWSVIMVYFFGSLVISYLVFSLSTRDFSFNPKFFLSMLVSSLSFLVMITYSFLFSFLLPKIAAFITVIICTLTTYISSWAFAEEGIKNIDLSTLSGFKILGAFFYTLAPRMGVIGKMASSLYSTETLELNIPLEIGHFVATYMLLIFVTYWTLKKKEI